MGNGFVTVFPGRRDHYEAAIALEEAGLLDCFVTDLYNKRGFVNYFLKKTSFSTKLSGRFSKHLQEKKIVTRPGYFIFNTLFSKIVQPSKVSVWQDDLFAKAAVAKARALKSNLLLYEFQADYAFRQHFAHPCKKVLFYFHTHPAWEHPLLAEDARQYPAFAEQVLKNTRQNLPFKYANHTKDAWKFADSIVVASGCTKRSLMEAGAAADTIKVIPYGFSPSDVHLPLPLLEKKPDRPFFLFVGSGTQRKGLHHLCKAWQTGGLTHTHDLIVVSRVVDHGMEDFLKLDSSIKWVTGLLKDELTWHYRNAVAFVMPSISEGFGQVYLEALSNGCMVIGTENSMLGDMPANEAIILVTPGNIIALQEAIAFAANKKPSLSSTASITALVKDYTWVNFRQALIKAIC